MSIISEGGYLVKIRIEKEPGIPGSFYLLPPANLTLSSGHIK
jgi:hypothetical protein